MFDQYILRLVETLGLFLGCLHLFWAFLAFKTRDPNVYSAFIAVFSFVTGASLLGIILFPPSVFAEYAVLSVTVSSLLILGGILVRSSKCFWKEIESPGSFWALQAFWAASALCLLYLLQADSINANQAFYQ